MNRTIAQWVRGRLGWALLALAGVAPGCSSPALVGRDLALLPPAGSLVVPTADGTIHPAGHWEAGRRQGASAEGGSDKGADLPMPGKVEMEPDDAPSAPANQKVADLHAYLQAPHTAEEYVWLALRRHPDIQAAARQVAAEMQTILQVTTLPDPVLSNTWWPISDHSPQTASGRMPYSMAIAQRFPWCGKLQRRGEVADLETQITLARLAQTQLRVAEAVKQAYYEVFFDQKAIRITQESEKLLGLYVKVAEARYKVGRVSQQDVLRIQVEQSRVRDQLIALRRELGVAQADLARVLSLPPSVNLQTAAALDLPPAPRQIEKLYEVAIAARPELRERLLAISRDQRRVDLAELEYYPDVTVGFNWQLMTTGAALSPVADGKDNLGLTVSVNLPIWQQRLRAGVWEARERTAASAARYTSEVDETYRLVRRLTVQARALEEQLALFRDDIIPKAEQTLRVSAADYRVGNVSVLQLLDNWGQLLRFQVQQVRLESSLGQVFAALERALGTLLARKWPAEEATDNKHKDSEKEEG